MNSSVILAAIAVMAVLIVVLVVASLCDDARAAERDVERALGDATLVTYEQAAAAGGKARQPLEQCAVCLSEYAKAGELVRLVPACGHFFHADCGVDKWLQERGTCPICRGSFALPRMPRPECPPMLARAAR